MKGIRVYLFFCFIIITSMTVRAMNMERGMSVFVPSCSEEIRLSFADASSSDCGGFVSEGKGTLWDTRKMVIERKKEDLTGVRTGTVCRGRCPEDVEKIRKDLEICNGSTEGVARVHLAAKFYTSVRLAEVLKEEDSNVLGPNGNAPLHYAVMANKVLNVRALLGVGADFNVRNVYGFSPLDIAIALEYYECRDRLSDALAVKINQTVQEIQLDFLSDSSSSLESEKGCAQEMPVERVKDNFFPEDFDSDSSSDRGCCMCCFKKKK